MLIVPAQHRYTPDELWYTVLPTSSDHVSFLLSANKWHCLETVSGNWVRRGNDAWRLITRRARHWHNQLYTRQHTVHWINFMLATGRSYIIYNARVVFLDHPPTLHRPNISLTRRQMLHNKLQTTPQKMAKPCKTVAITVVVQVNTAGVNSNFAHSSTFRRSRARTLLQIAKCTIQHSTPLL